VILSERELKIYSQNGEDGVIQAIFEVIGTTNQQSLEFGAHPRECNTKLLRAKGWNILCWDLEPHPEEWFAQELVTVSNINTLYRKHHLPLELDFLSIDVDSNDFHLWHVLAPDILPRVVCIEYNSALGAFDDLVVPMQEQVFWDGSRYFGASIQAMALLGRKRGYTLVYAEKNGTNLFFVRNDQCPPGTFQNQGQVVDLFAPPAYGVNREGHPVDPFERPFQCSRDYLRYNLQARIP